MRDQPWGVQLHCKQSFLSSQIFPLSTWLMTLVSSSFCLKKKKKEKEEEKKIDINHTQEGRSLQPPRRDFAMKTECKGGFDL
jgi:hypothetical protein